jgi:hypothetical protein
MVISDLFCHFLVNSLLFFDKFCVPIAGLKRARLGSGKKAHFFRAGSYV